MHTHSPSVVKVWLAVPSWYVSLMGATVSAGTSEVQVTVLALLAANSERRGGLIYFPSKKRGKAADATFAAAEYSLSTRQPTTTRADRAKSLAAVLFLFSLPIVVVGCRGAVAVGVGGGVRRGPPERGAIYTLPNPPHPPPFHVSRARGGGGLNT